MKFRIIFTILFSVIIVNVSPGQTKDLIEKKYGLEKYYKIRAFSLIRPKFDKEGRVCWIEVKPDSLLIEEPKPGSDFSEKPVVFHLPIYSVNDTERLFPIFILNSTELKEIFDELVPFQTRKGKGTSSIDISGFGHSYSAEYKFENIIIQMRVVRTEKGAIDMRGSGENLESFFNPPLGNISSAVIIWKIEFVLNRLSHKGPFLEQNR
jgi:hypothetical protein